jgi:hypothetical protein
MASASNPSGPERRRHQRYDVDLPVTLVMAADPGATHEARLKDLSAGGCLFEARLPREDFENATLSFRRALRAPLLAGKVVRRGQATFAISFDDIGADLLRLASALAAISPALRADFLSGFLDPCVEVY